MMLDIGNVTFQVQDQFVYSIASRPKKFFNVLEIPEIAAWDEQTRNIFFERLKRRFKSIVGVDGSHEDLIEYIAALVFNV